MTVGPELRIYIKYNSTTMGRLTYRDITLNRVGLKRLYNTSTMAGWRTVIIAFCIEEVNDELHNLVLKYDTMGRLPQGHIILYSVGLICWPDNWGNYRPLRKKISPNTDSPNSKQWNTTIKPFVIGHFAPENLLHKYNGTTLNSIITLYTVGLELFTKRVLMWA